MINGMRANLATSIGVAMAAALLLPLAPHATATGDPVPARAAGATGEVAERRMSGGTQSLDFTAGDATARGPGATADPGTRQIGARTVRPYSMLGVVWDRGDEEFHGTIRVRTREADTGRWSAWHELDSHPGDAPGAETPEAPGDEVRGATAPLWVGDSDGVQARILSERATGRALAGHHHQAAPPRGQRRSSGPAPASALPDTLPKGLRLELIDPGPEPAAPRTPARPRTPAAPEASGAERTPTAPQTPTAPKTPAAPQKPVAPGGPSVAGGDGAVVGPQSTATGAAGVADNAATRDALAAAQVARGAALPALSQRATAAEYHSTRPFIGPRPRIVTRKGWGADERIRESGHAYTKSVRVAFVHHTAMSNNYRCAQAPSIIRGMYRYHVLSSKWRDIGYNFLVDKCGTVYEGRSGGVAKPVMGAHTYGFNTNSTGIAVLGSYDKASPPAAAVDAISRLTAWKFGLFGVNPGGTNTLVSGGGTKYKKGKTVRFRTISGHRDGFNTACPGTRLYGKLGAARTGAARMQGR